MPGIALDLLLYKDDCEDPSSSLPKVIIPEPKVKCSEDLSEDDSEVTGGQMSPGVKTAPYCVFP